MPYDALSVLAVVRLSSTSYGMKNLQIYVSYCNKLLSWCIVWGMDYSGNCILV